MRHIRSTAVLIGTFNIYIIRPDWLGRIGLLPDNSEVKFETRLNEPGFRMQSANLGARWIVTPSRVVLEADQISEDCGSTLACLIEALPHTPLIAMGFNYTYEGDTDDIQDWGIKTQFPRTAPPQGYELKQRAWHTSVFRDPQTFNLQMGQNGDTVELRANVHTELKDRSTDWVIEQSQAYRTSRGACIQLLQSAFGATIDGEDI